MIQSAYCGLNTLPTANSPIRGTQAARTSASVALSRRRHTASVASPTINASRAPLITLMTLGERSTYSQALTVGLRFAL